MNCIDGNLEEPQSFFFNPNNTEIIELFNALYSFKISYGAFHRYLAFALCVAGILANLVHICVLTRSQMRGSSTHTTLTCIAVADVGTMCSYLLYIMRFEFLEDFRGYSYAWSEFLRAHAVFSIALHAISLYLVVFMAFIRLKALDVVQSKWMQPKKACQICILIALPVFIACVPTYMAHDIYVQRDERSGESGEVVYHRVDFSKSFLENGCALLKFNLWLSGLLLKALPCLLLLLLTFALLRRLRRNEAQRNERFFKFSMMLDQRQVSAPLRRCAAAAATSDRTTYALLIMLCIFLLTELPQGLFAILNAIFTYHFHSFVYMSIADVLDLLSLINCYVAFTVYILTSSTYRETLLSIFTFTTLSNQRRKNPASNKNKSPPPSFNNSAITRHSNVTNFAEEEKNGFI